MSNSRVLPILFKTDMVKAILEGRKTVTRRCVKFEGNRNPDWTGYIKDGLTLYNGTNEPCNKPAPYKVGDILYVRETYCWCPCWDCGMDTEEHNCCDKTANKFFNQDKKEWGCYGYKASFEDNEYPSVDTWHPSIHMPKEAARLFLKVTNVRLEKLRSMELSDFIAEGINLSRDELKDQDVALYKARKLFSDLWNSTSGKKETPKRYANNWYGNPWVWVIEFERCKGGTLDEVLK